MKSHNDSPIPNIIHTSNGSYRIPKEAVKSSKETNAAFIRRVGTKVLDLVIPTNTY